MVLRSKPPGGPPPQVLRGFESNLSPPVPYSAAREPERSRLPHGLASVNLSPYATFPGDRSALSPDSIAWGGRPSFGTCCSGQADLPISVRLAPSYLARSQEIGIGEDEGDDAGESRRRVLPNGCSAG